VKDALFGKTLEELQELALELGLPKFNGKQIAQWLYQKQITSIDEMSNLSKKARELLKEKYCLGLTAHSKVQCSVDGTKKYLFPYGERKIIESAYIPEKDRATLCVSSQVGCKMGCLFCMTGKQGFQFQLSAGEIVNQIHSLPEKETLTNVVYMGMGEPFDNLEEVLKSTQILMEEWGYAWSPKRVTVSTIGVLPALKRFVEESKAHLALSLHSPFHEERLQLMPIENVYPVEDVIDYLKSVDFGRQRRISFEYIMFKGVNDTAEHIKGLTKLLSGMKCRMNLIKFHPIPNSPLLGSDNDTMEWFRDKLTAKGITTTIRRSRGEDIFAACGLLSTKEMVKKNNQEK